MSGDRIEKRGRKPKLNNTQKQEIIAKGKYTVYKKLAEEYNVSLRTIKYICK